LRVEGLGLRVAFGGLNARRGAMSYAPTAGEEKMFVQGTGPRRAFALSCSPAVANTGGGKGLGFGVWG